MSDLQGSIGTPKRSPWWHYVLIVLLAIGLTLLNGWLEANGFSHR